jgi:hypothetical protein
MTVNESLRNAGISHAIYLQRYKTSEVNRVIELLNTMDRDLFTRLERDLRPLTRERLERILKNVRSITTEARQELYNRLKDDLKEFAGYESDFQVRKVQSILPITVSLDAIAPAQLWAAANSEVFGDAKMSKYLDGWIRDWGDTKFARVEGMYRRGFAEGRTNQELVRILRGTKVRGYADGLLEIDRRSAAQITRMATAHVANVARERTFENNRDVIKGVQAVATLDGRTTLICINLDGKVDLYDGSRQELKGKRPPYHWGCLPGNSLVLSRFPITGHSKRWYDGKMVVIRTSAGRELTCTPNHPILSDRGWVAADTLDLGSKVVCDGVCKWPPLANDNGQYRPSLIENISKTLLESGKMIARPMPVSSEDFHGDGIDGQIAIITSNRCLPSCFYSTIKKHVCKHAFVRRNTKLSLFARLRHKTFFSPGFLSSCRSLMSSLSDKLFFFLGAICHTFIHCLRSISKRDSLFFKNLFYYGLATTESSTNIGKPHTLFIKTHYIRGWKMNASFKCARYKSNIGITQSSKYGGGSYSKLARDILSGSTGKIFFDNVIDIQIRNFSGHVYNLETTKGFYIADGIITHNCRTAIVPIVKSWRELGVDLDEAPEGARASMNGQVASTIKYPDWLKDQPAVFQRDVLGASRYAMWKNGTPLSRFVDDARVLTLGEMKKREAE